jgi:uncharacterized protein YgiM (DUF1202 family)
MSRFKLVAVLLALVASLACNLSIQPALPATNTPTACASATNTPRPLATNSGGLVASLPTETPAPYCIVTASNGAGGGSLYVRSGPGVEYQWVKVLQSGDKLPMIDTEGDWVQVPGGWVSRYYVECNRLTK